MVCKQELEDQPGYSHQRHRAELLLWLLLAVLFVCLLDYRLSCLCCTTDNKFKATRGQIFEEVSLRECQLPFPSSTANVLWHLKITALLWELQPLALIIHAAL